jgi:hypothetical protein
MPPFIVFMLGAVAGAVAAAFAPELRRNARPLLKEALKAGILFTRDAQVNAVELLESLEDIYAEAKAEADHAGLADGETNGSAPRARTAAARRNAVRKAPANPAKPAAKRAAKRSGKQPAKGSASQAA